MKKASPPPRPPTIKEERLVIWTVETDYYTNRPRVKKYAGVELRKTGAKVLVYGKEKFIPPSLGRKFFVDEDAVKRYCRQWLERRRELLIGQLAEVREILGARALEYEEQRAEPLGPVVLKERPDPDWEPPKQFLKLPKPRS